MDFFFKASFFLINVHYSSSKLERIVTLIIKREKGIEINKIHFYNTLEHIWLKRVVNYENYEFWGCGFYKSYSFLCDKKTWMHNIHHIRSRCNKKYLHTIHNGKLCMKNRKNKTIDQYRNVMCDM